jgi:hypothetical protein
LLPPAHLHSPACILACGVRQFRPMRVKLVRPCGAADCESIAKYVIRIWRKGETGEKRLRCTKHTRKFCADTWLTGMLATMDRGRASLQGHL